MQDCSISSALAMKILQSCTKALMYDLVDYQSTSLWYLWPVLEDRKMSVNTLTNNLQFAAVLVFIYRIKTGSGGVCNHNAWGRVRNRKSNPDGFSPRDLTYCSHKPECIVKTHPDRSVLIMIITWHFQFHPVYVSNLHIKGAYVLEARAVSHAPPIVTSRGTP